MPISPATSYEADNIGRIYKIAGSEVLPTGRTVPEWASRNDITEAEFDQRFAAQERRNAETWAVAQPWLDLGAKWQAILDRELPTSPMGRRAREVLDYIDTQLARLSGR